MKLPPSWLALLPFVESQFTAVAALLKDCATSAQYNLLEDWRLFSNQQQHLDSFALLRKFRKSRLAYIAYLDFSLPLEDHIKSMRLVADLADLLIVQAYQIAQQEMLDKFGPVINSQGEHIELQIFALGKLGTQELNYSSDVDLVFIYDGSGVSKGPRSLDAEVYFTRMGQKIIKLLDYFSADGLVYRVDMRLRPFGSAGPLVCSANSLYQYLINEGRDWERFAWMRARFVGGNENSAIQIIKEVKSFIYRKHLDYSVFTSLAKIKQEISLTYKQHEGDLKHGIGGIRTIEFIVQSLQLVFGGRNLPLQGTAIYPQLENLVQAHKLSTNDAALIAQTWLYLRKLENISQIVNDQSVHELPVGVSLRLKVAEFCGFATSTALDQQLKVLTEKVDMLFKQLFETAHPTTNLKPTDQKLQQILLDELNLQRVPQEIVERVGLLLEQTVVKASERVCYDFVALIKVILKRPSYLLMLLKEKNIHNNVLQLLEKDSYFIGILVQYPVLLEQLFEHQTLGWVNEEALEATWQLNNFVGDVEAWMEQLRYFKWVHQFNAMRSLMDGFITTTQLGQQLSQLARYVLSQVVRFSWQETSDKLEKTQFSVDQLMVIAYGSMAVNQMTVNSDLDLVFVVDSADMNADDRLFVQRWIKRIMHHLTSNMYHGHLYDIDLQLRPNGNSGTLMTSWDEFAKYQEREAWTWEHAAMVKSKLVVGSAKQIEKHQILRKTILMRTRDFLQVDEDLSGMADKLKLINLNKDHGKDLALLGLVLKYANQYPELVETSDMLELTARLNELKLL